MRISDWSSDVCSSDLALDLAESDVILYPLMAGGSFGRKMEADAAVQAAIIAREMNRPVQLLWSRAEDIIHDRPRAPARSEEHTSELQSLMRISYAVFCLKKKTQNTHIHAENINITP